MAHRDSQDSLWGPQGLLGYGDTREALEGH